MPFQFRLRTLFLVVACVPLVMLAMSSIQAVWDGSFKLTVRLKDPRVTSITRLDHRCVSRHEAERMVAHPIPQDFVPVSLVRDELVVDVACWGRSSILGWGDTYDHFRYIVIWAHYRDGTDHCQVVEIPYGRGARTIEVDFGPEQDAVGAGESFFSEPARGSKGG